MLDAVEDDGDPLVGLLLRQPTQRRRWRDSVDRDS